MSEAQNFPELADFYQEEVIQPGQALIRRVLQRGVDAGEFRPLDLNYAIYSVVAPMIFLILAKHSAGICVRHDTPLEPHQFIASQLAIVLHGLSATSAHGRTA